MVGEDAVANLTASFPDLAAPIATLTTVLQVIGGIIGVYVIFWVISSLINARRLKFLEKILVEIKLVNKNLEKLNRNKSLRKKSSKK